MSDYPSYDEQVQQRQEDVVVELNLAQPVTSEPASDPLPEIVAIGPDDMPWTVVEHPQPEPTLAQVRATWPKHTITPTDDGGYDVEYEHQIDHVERLSEVHSAAGLQSFFVWLHQ